MRYTCIGINVLAMLAVSAAAAPTPAAVSAYSTYTNKTYGIRLDYPVALELRHDFADDMVPGEGWRLGADAEDIQGTPLVALVMPGSNRFTAAELRLGVSGDPQAVATCRQLPSFIRGETREIELSGRSFTTFQVEDAAMGHYKATHSYRTLHDGLCYAMDVIVYGSNPDPARTPADKLPFTRADAFAYLEPVARGIVLTESGSTAQRSPQPFADFIDAGGYTEIDLPDFPGSVWYTSARFPGLGSGQTGSEMPDRDLDAVTRMLLFVESREKALPHARYFITYRLSAAPDDARVQHAYVAVTRFNLGPALRQETVSMYGEEHTAPARVFGIGSHVAWRFVTTARQGMNAAIVRASRKEISNEAARAMDCLGVSCLSLRDPTGPGGDWQQPRLPDFGPPVFSDSADDMPGPARIAEYLFDYATRNGFEPAFGAFADQPQMIFVVSKNVAGQDRNITGVLHQPHIMDHTISDIWTRRRQAGPDAVEWRTLVVARPRMGSDVPTSKVLFSKYPVAVYDGPPAQLPPFTGDDPDSPAGRAYQALQQNPQYAGLYVIATRDCGATCKATQLVNKRTGQALARTFRNHNRPSPLLGHYRASERNTATGKQQTRSLPVGQRRYLPIGKDYLVDMRPDSRVLVTGTTVKADYGSVPYKFLRQYSLLRDGQLHEVSQMEVPLPLPRYRPSAFGSGLHHGMGSQANMPRFGDHAVDDIYTGPPGRLQLNVSASLRQHIAEQMKAAPVFAGAYVIAQQRCDQGAYCKLEFLVNRRTGQAVPTYFKSHTVAAPGDHQQKPQPVGEWVRTAFADSRLLVTQKVTTDVRGQPADPYLCYYVLRDGDLQRIWQMQFGNPYGHEASIGAVP